MAKKDTNKIKPFTGVKGKTEKQLAQEAQKKSAVKGAAKGAGAGAASKIVQDITNRYRVTAREARDIVTAVSTAAKEPKFKSDVSKQIAEVGKAATKGEKGSSAWVVKGKTASKTPSRYDKGVTTKINKDTKVQKWVKE